jgi:hypothetical protein
MSLPLDRYRGIVSADVTLFSVRFIKTFFVWRRLRRKLYFFYEQIFKPLICTKLAKFQQWQNS